MSDSNKETYYVVNRSKVLSEELDGETIIINLETGNYYSMNKAGSALWGLLQDRRSYRTILTHLSARADAEAGEFKTSLDDALSLLKRDGLVLESESGNTAEPAPNGPDEGGTLETVSITKYEDMQEMLLADPIHDVDKTGWPGVKPDKK